MKIPSISDHRGTFFKVLGGTDLSQIAVMTITPGNDSGYENAHSGDQVVYILEGEAVVEIEDKTIQGQAGDAVIIPKGARHLIRNEGAGDLYFLNVYTPPQY